MKPVDAVARLEAELRRVHLDATAAVKRARQRLGADAVEADPDDLKVTVNVTVDPETFEACVPIAVSVRRDVDVDGTYPSNLTLESGLFVFCADANRGSSPS